MAWKPILISVAIFAFLFGESLAQEANSKSPRKWDQEKAIAKVKAVLTQEQQGEFAWDEISWLTDVDSAIQKSKSKRKPILLYFYLKGENGPAKALC